MTRLPPGADRILKRLLDAGYEAYLVGGSVRDLLLGRRGGDLDFTTNARPDALQRIFPRSHYPNRFGTVLVRAGGAQHEVTTYRGEGRYSDHRHPDQILFVDRLEDDLRRRDFTINAMAMSVDGAVVDPFDGRQDLQRHLIRAVGDPVERLAEDPLRMMRAVRLAAQLGFTIERATWDAIAANARLLTMISRERVRDELLKILASERPVTGIDFLDHLGLLDDALPELAASRRLNRPAGEREDVYQHALQTLRACRGGALLRLAALLHVLTEAIGSGQSAVGEGGDADNVVGRGLVPRRAQPVGSTEAGEPPALPGGAALDRELERLRLSNADTGRVRRLIDALPAVPPDLPADERSARRLLSAYGALLPDLLDLVEAHRSALVAPDEPQDLGQLARLRGLVVAAERTGQPRSLEDLAVTGDDLMRELDLQPGPQVGRLLRALLDRVLDDPALNTRETLLALARRL